MAAVLKIQNLTKQFEGLVAVNDLSIDMEERTIHSLIGPNGSGKSTTINMITGTFQATSGHIWHRDVEITSLPPYQIAKTGLNRTYQNLKLFNSMTVMDNLMVGMHMKTKQNYLSFLLNFSQANREEKEMREKAKEILDYTGLYNLRNEYVNNISYGRQKMTELARALMNGPGLLLLDEPAAGLNPTERGEFVSLLQKVFNSGIDLFLIEHNMDVVMNISNRITVINFGAKIAEGTADEIQNNDEVIKAYLGERYRQIKKEA